MMLAGRLTALRPLVTGGDGSGPPRPMVRAAASATPPTISKVVTARGMSPAFFGPTGNGMFFT
ncbi:MAG: hypothetical protein AUH35_01550 [Nitrospirae bacterium 13_1_40CM_62_7]|nr:MAG: hypothetical protein AUH35_01550 [Nitrospirae bacterium 13_1_40CM_62_7]OLC42985.1 MAG: hypothetical protein AUH74_03305 [Nitrospirae bacterium 13_1_40CM_4_62_6]OLC81873.1 MAG: hypothetical protein AUI96_00875 [Nitrospirae bacterium 13_1_40CM_3_62_11]OLD42103.1 MAG: hypothetical protein AUI21_00110 [Nitrospirae bacterium 13_1_40CM_2_62_10]OLD75148.1 MAG: hypothetical protein AUG95_00750 [Nitrospirae bacterium 13_1_20CM_4_62_6]